MLDIEKALKLKNPDNLLKAAKEAEQRNCEQGIIRKLYDLYYEAVGKKERRCNP